MSLVENFKSFVSNNRALILVVFSVVLLIILYYFVFLRGNKYKCTESGCVFSLTGGKFKNKDDCSKKCTTSIDNFEQEDLTFTQEPLVDTNQDPNSDTNQDPNIDLNQEPTGSSPIPRNKPPSTLPSQNRRTNMPIDTNFDPSEYEPNKVEEGFTSKFLTDNNVMNVREQINKKKGMNPHFATADDVVGVVTDQDVFPYQRMFRGIPESSVPIVYERESGWRDRHDDAYRSNMEPNLEQLGIFQDTCEDKKDKSHGHNDQKNPKQLHFCSADINRNIQASYFYCNEQEEYCYDDSPKYCKSGSVNQSGYVYCYDLSPRDADFATPINPDDPQNYVPDNDSLYCSSHTLETHTCGIMALNTGNNAIVNNANWNITGILNGGGAATINTLSDILRPGAAQNDTTTLTFTSVLGDANSSIIVQRGGNTLSVADGVTNFTIEMTFIASGVNWVLSTIAVATISEGTNQQYAVGYQAGDEITIDLTNKEIHGNGLVDAGSLLASMTITLPDGLNTINVANQQINNTFSCWAGTEDCSDGSSRYCPTVITSGANAGTHQIQHICNIYLHGDGTPGWESHQLADNPAVSAPVPNAIFACEPGESSCADNNKAYCAEIEWSGDDDLIERMELHNCASSKSPDQDGYYFFCPANDPECRDNSDKYCIHGNP
jgi:hypothetical protein